MSWIFSKSMMDHCESLRYSQGREAESLGEDCSDGGQYAQLNVMPTPQMFLHNGKMMDASSLSRYGLTCAVLKEDHGEDLLMLYRAGFRAKTSAQQEEVPESKESDQDYGQNLRGLLARYDQDTHSLKTAQCSLFVDLIESSVTLHRWGILQNGELYPHPVSGLHTSEREFGLSQLPTPTASQYGTNKKEGQIARPSLATMARQNKWPTPQASDNRDRGNMSDPSILRRIEKGKQIGLSTFVKEQAGHGSLNPDWTEWLMGWPIGWTDLKPLEMDRFQLWQQQHSIYCQEND